VTRGLYPFRSTHFNSYDIVCGYNDVWIVREKSTLLAGIGVKGYLKKCLLRRGIFDGYYSPVCSAIYYLLGCDTVRHGLLGHLSES